MKFDILRTTENVATDTMTSMYGIYFVRARQIFQDFDAFIECTFQTQGGYITVILDESKVTPDKYRSIKRLLSAAIESKYPELAL